MIQGMLVTTLCYIVVAGLLTYFAGFTIFVWVWVGLLLVFTGINFTREKTRNILNHLYIQVV